MKNFIKDHRFLTGLLSVFISVFLVSIVAYGATTIGDDIETGIASTTGAVLVGGDVGDDDDIIYFDASEENLTWDNTDTKFTLTDDLDITGWASTTSELNTRGTLHVGGAASIDGALTIGTSSVSIAKIIGGVCSVEFVGTLVGNEATTSLCTATGVVAGDRIMVTPFWLEDGLSFQAASSTAADTIRIAIWNSSSSAITAAAWNWQWFAFHE